MMLDLIPEAPTHLSLVVPGERASVRSRPQLQENENEIKHGQERDVIFEKTNGITNRKVSSTCVVVEA
jgi:hypothetical protein